MNEQDYISIEAYLQGDMDKAARTTLEARVAAEPTFAQALAERQRLHEHLTATAKEPELLASLDTLGRQYFPEKEVVQEAVIRPLGQGRKRKNWVGFAVAATIALLLALTVTLWWPSGGNTYQQFAQHQPVSLTERGNSTELAGRAEAAYNAQEYTTAIPLLEEYLQQSDDERAKLALGVSLLESNKDSAAVSVFTEIAESASTLAPYGNWYLALAAVKRGDSEATLKFLEKIPASDTYLQQQAEKLKATL